MPACRTYPLREVARDVESSAETGGRSCVLASPAVSYVRPADQRALDHINRSTSFLLSNRSLLGEHQPKPDREHATQQCCSVVQVQWYEKQSVLTSGSLTLGSVGIRSLRDNVSSLKG